MTNAEKATEFRRLIKEASVLDNELTADGYTVVLRDPQGLSAPAWYPWYLKGTPAIFRSVQETL